MTKHFFLMFFYFYQICAVIFLLQGILSPVLLILAGVLWWRQSHRLERLKQEIETLSANKVESEADYEAVIQLLPKLKPLKCANCGAGAVIHKTDKFCPHCRAHEALPADYAAIAPLKLRTKSLLKSAVKHWRVANFLTHPLIGWSFFLLIFIEPLVLFPAVLIGSNVYPNTWIDRSLESIGETTAFVIGLMAFLGFINWMVIFVMLTNLSRSLHTNLPLIPVPEADLREDETANCQGCGGALEYSAAAFAGLCSYCNLINLRARFIRRAHRLEENQQDKAKSSLFGAMQINEDFISTFFFLSLILSIASVLLIIIHALRE